MSDVGRSLEYDLVHISAGSGFREHYRLGDPVSYAIVERDAVSVHLMPASQDPRGLGRSSIYVFVADVDEVHRQLQASGDLT